MTASLCIAGATVRFGVAEALADVTFSVSPGEWLALIGPNGAGKTTLLRAIAAAMPLDSGAVEVEGDPLAALPARERARRIGVVPQDHALPAGWNVEQVVAQGRSPHVAAWRREGPVDREAVRSAINATNLTPLSRRLVEGLSGGERQRVLLARALAQTPRILLLDEPTAFLDLQYQWEMLELVEEARQARGLTVLSVLHDLNLAAAFADRVALLKDGRILSLGSPEAVLTEDTIESAYGRRVTIGRHPATGRPTVLSWPSETRPAVAGRVHVISGGGSGAAVLRRLVSDGQTVTGGVLNVGDTDWETATALGIPVAEEAPFSPISPSALAAADTYVRLADAVLVAPMPLGPGNLDNLRLAVEAAKRGQRVVLAGDMDSNRDFTGGRAERLWEAARSAGAVPVSDVAGAMAALRAYLAHRV